MHATIADRVAWRTQAVFCCDSLSITTAITLSISPAGARASCSSCPVSSSTAPCLQVHSTVWCAQASVCMHMEQETSVYCRALRSACTVLPSTGCFCISPAGARASTYTKHGVRGCETAIQGFKSEWTFAHRFAHLVRGLQSQSALSFAATSAPTSPSAGPQGACERAERRRAAVHLLRSTSPPPVTDGRCNHSASEREGEVTTVPVIGWDRDGRPLSLPTSLVSTTSSSTASPFVRPKCEDRPFTGVDSELPKLGKF